MSWSTGADIAENLWEDIVEYIPENKKKIVAKKIINIFESYDCDTMCETSLYEIAKKRK